MPIQRVSEKPPKNLPDEARISLDDALEGGADFFVLAVLDYQNPLRTSGAPPKPYNVSLRLFKTAPYRFLYSMEYNPADKDELAAAMGAARAIARHLKD
ncbi:hypothetical protein AGMMS49940_15140 [Spirochaetia bacterium]|nr:hypothetical protein AGMMS49940_15140 [Spirochaetia bacterium]